MLPQRLVLITPGTTLFTRMGASSTASARTNPSMAPQIADATDQPLPGRVLAIPLVKLMEPPGLRFFAPYFTAAKALQKRILKNERACSISVFSIIFNVKFSPAVYT